MIAFIDTIKLSTRTVQYNATSLKIPKTIMLFRKTNTQVIIIHPILILIVTKQKKYNQVGVRYYTVQRSRNLKKKEIFKNKKKRKKNSPALLVQLL